MKINTTFSVVIRIILWLFMLIGGAFYAYKIDKNDLLFHSPLFHLLSALIGIFILRLVFRSASNGGKELAKGRDKTMPRLETNRLVTTGIYSCMRHPMLFGLTLLPLGWALLLGMPTFITLVAPLEMIFIVFMVIVFEEMEVKRKFGDDYRVYSQNVPMVSFRHKCLRRLFRRYKR